MTDRSAKFRDGNPTFQVQSNSGNVHFISFGSAAAKERSTDWSCDCMDWIIRKNNRCKHLRNDDRVVGGLAPRDESYDSGKPSPAFLKAIEEAVAERSATSPLQKAKEYGFQLAHHVGDYPMEFPCVAEFKFDGQLVMAIGGEFFSRQFNDVSACFPELEKISNAVIVGEVCVVTKDKPCGDFNLILQRKVSDPLKARIRSQSIPATFMAFDILELNGEDLTAKDFADRRAMLKEWFAENHPLGWELVEQIEVNSAAEVEGLRENAYKLGIEGYMFKKLGARWSATRSANFLKLKTVKEEDFAIEKWEETVGDKGERGFVVFIRNENGGLQKVAVGSDRDRRLIKSGAKKIEVKYLRKSADGVLYQPVLSRLKEDF